MSSAEVAYLFRHALVRDACYSLHLPSERGRLHGLALAVLESVIPVSEQAPAAAELAEHARRAISDDTVEQARLGAREVHWLQVAAEHAIRGYRSTEALSILQRIIEHEYAHADNRADAHVSAGWQHYWAGRRDAAASHWQQAYAMAETEDDMPRKIKALGSLADLATHEGRHAEAEQQYRRLLELARGHGHRSLAGTALGSLGNLLRTLGRLQEAEPVYRQALAIALECQPSTVALRTSNLGLVLADTGRVDEAEELFRSALAQAETTSDTRSQAIFVNNIALVMRKRGNYAQAEEAMQRAIALTLESGQAYNLGQFYSHLAGILSDAGKLDEAEQAFGIAQSDLLEHNHALHQCNSLTSWAKLRMRQGRPQEALEKADASIALAGTNGQARDEATGARALALRALGREQEAELALEQALAGLRSRHDIEATKSLLERFKEATP